MISLQKKFGNNQYVLFEGNYGVVTIDLGSEDYKVNQCRLDHKTTLMQLKPTNPSVHDAIVDGGADDAENEPINVYRTEDGYIYVMDFWQ